MFEESAEKMSKKEISVQDEKEHAFEGDIIVPGIASS